VRVAALVVGELALAPETFEHGRVHGPRAADLGGRLLERVESGTCVAAGAHDDRVRGLGRQLDRTSEAALGVRQRTNDDRVQVVVGQWAQLHDPRPADQRGVDLEEGVLRRGSDEHHEAVLDRVQERVLLGLREPVDLVDEQGRPAPVELQAVARLLDRLSDVGDSGRHR